MERKLSLSRGRAATFLVLGLAVVAIVILTLLLAPLVTAFRDFSNALPSLVSDARSSSTLSSWLDKHSQAPDVLHAHAKETASAVIFGWTGGKALVETSYSGAKEKVHWKKKPDSDRAAPPDRSVAGTTTPSSPTTTSPIARATAPEGSAGTATPSSTALPRLEEHLQQQNDDADDETAENGQGE